VGLRAFGARPAFTAVRSLIRGRTATCSQKTRYIEYQDAELPHAQAPTALAGCAGADHPRRSRGYRDRALPQQRSERFLRNPPHGFRYTKDNEGATTKGVNSGQAPGAGAEIDVRRQLRITSGPPTKTAALVPAIPRRWSGGTTRTFNEPLETNRGLIGPFVITRRAGPRPDGTRRTSDREFVTPRFSSSTSWKARSRTDASPSTAYIFGNLTGLVMHNGDRVRWYVLGMGNEDRPPQPALAREDGARRRARQRPPDRQPSR
jgi:hypothetical protein